MRIVVSGEGTRGDLYPLLALGDACRQAGHEVSVCAPPNFEAEVTARGFAFSSSGIDARDYLEAHAGAVVRGGLAMAASMRSYLDTMMQCSFEALHAGTEGADLLVGAGVHLAGSTVAAQRGIPYRYVAYVPNLLPSPEHTPAFLGSSRPWPRWLNQLTWRWLMPLLFLPVVYPINRKRTALGIAPEWNAFRLTLGERPVLLATDADLAPAPLDCPLDVVQIGALQTDVEGPLPEKLEAFLAAGPPPVYFGFGSMTDPDAAATTRLLLEAIERAGCRALISGGWARLGETPLPEHVLALGPVSHARLFPRVAAVVHHGGAGTTTTAARAGVPQLVVPHLLDQYYWAERVRSLGIGPAPLLRNRLDATQLGDWVRATLGNEWLEQNARELGAKLRAGDPLRPDGHETLLRQLLG